MFIDFEPGDCKNPLIRMGIGQVQSIIGEKLRLISRIVAKGINIENIKLEKLNDE